VSNAVYSSNANATPKSMKELGQEYTHERLRRRLGTGQSKRTQEPSREETKQSRRQISEVK
jgi:hypothetical protein